MQMSRLEHVLEIVPIKHIYFTTIVIEGVSKYVLLKYTQLILWTFMLIILHGNVLVSVRLDILHLNIPQILQFEFVLKCAKLLQVITISLKVWLENV